MPDQAFPRHHEKDPTATQEPDVCSGCRYVPCGTCPHKTTTEGDPQ